MKRSVGSRWEMYVSPLTSPSWPLSSRSLEAQPEDLLNLIKRLAEASERRALSLEKLMTELPGYVVQVSHSR